MAMNAVYDYRLVALSVAIAICAAYAALDLAGRVTASDRRLRAVWLFGGASAMGFGIWAMHYIGMLALIMSVPMFYHVPTVLLSLLAANTAAAVALYTVSRSHMTAKDSVFGSLAMGGAIAAMHFIGMAAMRLQAVVRYSLDLVLLSLFLAVAISWVGLWLTFQVREDRGNSRRKLLNALVMGSAIPVMHYTGMASASFSPSNHPPNLAHAMSISSLGTTAIAVGCFVVLIFVSGTAFVHRRLESQKVLMRGLQKSEAEFRNLAEAFPEMIWTARSDGSVDYYNRHWDEYTGRKFEDSGGWSWDTAVHPEDLPACLEKWRHSLQVGEIHEVEIRLRSADGGYRWHLIRAVPVRDANQNVVKWFGSGTDIEKQKRSQQTLEEQVREHTAELVAANARLKQEMEDKEAAQTELNRQSERVVRELTESSKKASQLRQMGELMQSCTNMEEAVSIVLGFAPKIFQQLRGALILLTPSKTHLEVAGSWSNCELPNSSYDANACWAIRTGHLHAVDAGDPSAPCAHAEGMKNAYFCVPILAQGETIGIIHFQATGNNKSWFEYQLTLASTFTEQVGLSISNIRLRELLKNQSIKDPLTGVFNRRYLGEFFERETRRVIRAKQSLGVIMLDLDHFKKFNDTYGHGAGDKVLQELGLTLVKSVRAEDVVCRYGGEEFIILLPGADAGATYARAEQIRSRVRELTISWEGKSLGVLTISAGTAGFPEHGSSAQVVAAADAALYRAKRSGRDRMVVAQSVESIASPESAEEHVSKAEVRV